MWNKPNQINNEKGFSLIEILVVMSIFLIIITMAANFIIYGFQGISFGSEQETAIENARKAMEEMTKEIRGANSSESGSYPLAMVNDDEIIFYTDTDIDGQMEKIRYYLASSTLIKETTEPGTANDYSAAPEVTDVAYYINNQVEPIFYYFDSNNEETDIINEIRLVNIRLKVNVTPEKAPNDYYVESDVNLRNLKDNL